MSIKLMRPWHARARIFLSSSVLNTATNSKFLTKIKSYWIILLDEKLYRNKNSHYFVIAILSYQIYLTSLFRAST